MRATNLSRALPQVMGRHDGSLVSGSTLLRMGTRRAWRRSSQASSGMAPLAISVHSSASMHTHAGFSLNVWSISVVQPSIPGAVPVFMSSMAFSTSRGEMVTTGAFAGNLGRGWPMCGCGWRAFMLAMSWAVPKRGGAGSLLPGCDCKTRAALDRLSLITRPITCLAALSLRVSTTSSGPRPMSSSPRNTASSWTCRAFITSAASALPLARRAWASGSGPSLARDVMAAIMSFAMATALARSFGTGLALSSVNAVSAEWHAAINAIFRSFGT